MPLVQSDRPNDVEASEMKVDGMLGAYKMGLESPQLKADISKMFPEFLYKGFLDWYKCYLIKVIEWFNNKSDWRIPWKMSGDKSNYFRAATHKHYAGDFSLSIFPVEIYRNVRPSFNSTIWAVVLIKGKGWPHVHLLSVHWPNLGDTFSHIDKEERQPSEVVLWL